MRMIPAVSRSKGAIKFMSNVKKIQAALGDLPALVMTDAVSIKYACGFHIDDGAAVIGRDKAWVVTDSRYVEAAAAAITDMQVLCTSRDKGLSAILGGIFADAGFEKAGAMPDRLSHARWTWLEKAVGVPLVDAGSILRDLRAIKDRYEVDSITAAQRIAEKALDEVLGLIKPGMTEKQIAAELVYRMYKYGGEGNSFDPIVVTGAKSSMPHGVPGDNVVQAGDFITMDFGTLYNGYCSDMTRTVAVGHVTDEMRKVYDTVLQAQLAGIEEAGKPGVTGAAVHNAAARVIADAGYGQYFGHGFGHSLGLEIHEDPGARPGNDKPLPVGAVISAEPGIYLPGRFGVRIEDMLWLREDGAEDLTKAPKELIIL